MKLDELFGNPPKIQLDERGARMGARELQSAQINDFTIGFEFEIAIENGKHDIENLSNSFREMWDPPSEEDFFDDVLKYNVNLIDAEPKYGWHDKRQGIFYTDFNDPQPKARLSSIAEIEEFNEFFDYDKRDFYAAYDDYCHEQYQQELQNYLDENLGHIDSLDYAADTFRDLADGNIRISTSYHGQQKDIENWFVEPDSSIEPAGAEVVTPPMPFKQGVKKLIDVLNIIKTDAEMSTNSSTGLHINIGIPEETKIDLLKLCLFMGESHVLDLFDRQDNRYASLILPDLAAAFNDNSINLPVDEINSIILQKAEKFRTVNFLKYREGKNYFEFRAAGNENYQNKTREIVDTILRYARALQLACDPQAERKAYLTKLYKFFNNQSAYARPKEKEKAKIKDQFEKLLSDLETKLLVKVFEKINSKYNNVVLKDLSLYQQKSMIYEHILYWLKEAASSSIDFKISEPVARIIFKIFQFCLKHGKLTQSYLNRHYNDYEYWSKLRSQKFSGNLNMSSSETTVPDWWKIAFFGKTTVPDHVD